MRLFGGKRRKTVRKLTPEQEERKTELKRKQFLSDEYIQMAKSDSELKRQMVAKEFNLIFPEKDPLKEQKHEINEIITTEALQILKNDPELKQQFGRKRIETIIGEAPILSEGEGYPPGSAIGQVLEEIEEFDALKEKLGGGKGGGWGDLLKDPAVAISIVNLIKTLVGQGSAIPQEPTYVVQINGQPKKVTETEYKQLEAQGLIKPIAAIEAPQVPPEEIKKEPKPEPPAFLSTMEEFAWMLDLIPEDFVSQLESDIQEGLPQPQLFWNFLSSTDYEKVVELITPYKDNEQVGSYVEKLLSEEGKIWLEEVIKLVREKLNE